MFSRTVIHLSVDEAGATVGSDSAPRGGVEVTLYRRGLYAEKRGSELVAVGREG